MQSRRPDRSEEGGRAKLAPGAPAAEASPKDTPAARVRSGDREPSSPGTKPYISRLHAVTVRLEPICDVDLIYREGPFGQKFSLVRSLGGEEGWGYGEGGGTFKGAKLAGELRWVNHPRHRGDGSVLPDIDGVLKTGDGAIVLFKMHGKTVWVRGMGRQALAATFETEDSRYKWLNDSFCIVEGAVDGPGLRIRGKMHLCVNELV